MDEKMDIELEEEESTELNCLSRISKVAGVLSGRVTKLFFLYLLYYTIYNTMYTASRL